MPGTELLKPKLEWLYENDYDNTVRYILGTKGVNPMICFGINPSTAEPDKLDNTLKSVARLASNNGFDSWIMLNIYPQRATNPKDIHKSMDSDIHAKNIHFMDQLFSSLPKATIWAAWGTLIESRSFLMNCLSDIHKISLTHNCSWVTIGNKSKKGHPHHPLYLKSTTITEPFDMRKYVKKLA